jgi:dihydroorotase
LGADGSRGKSDGRGFSLSILLKNGNLLDPESKELVQRDLWIDGQKIRAIAPEIRPDEEVTVIWADGKLVCPGLIDMHVHLREPGFEQKETIESGCRAAARGGFTTIAPMPNTNPVTDSPDKIKEVIDRAKKTGLARVLPYGAITVGQRGEELTDMAGMKKAGAIGVTDDGVGVQSAKMMKEAMKKAVAEDLPVVAHCEDDTLAKGGCVHEGVFAKKHGLTGIPSSAEAIHVGRDILLAEETGAHYHVCHISTQASVRLVREAKARGQKVTAEVTPHHLLLCDEDIPGPDPNWKMNPPLRSKEDRQALIEGLKDGSIDFIATDHAPHTVEEKQAGIEQAPFGIVGLETAFPLLYTHLVIKGVLTLHELVDKMTLKPAQVFRLPYGRLVEGGPADITVIDLDREKVIDPKNFASKGRNTPFAGWKLKGWPVLTILDGKVTWQDDDCLM